ncbi:MAG: thioesterase family protein [Alistipes sp.]|nr:thioesterase family protein [Alistipes sp.]
METGLSYTSTIVVDSTNTANALGSGDMDVFATPAMVALMENAAMKAVAPYLEEGETTVGSHINTTHIKPSALDALISATAVLTAVEGRKLIFTVAVRDERGIIGEGEHVRFVVKREKFMSKLLNK